MTTRVTFRCENPSIIFKLAKEDATPNQLKYINQAAETCSSDNGLHSFDIDHDNFFDIRELIFERAKKRIYIKTAEIVAGALHNQQPIEKMINMAETSVKHQIVDDSPTSTPDTDVKLRDGWRPIAEFIECDPSATVVFGNWFGTYWHRTNPILVRDGGEPNDENPWGYFFLYPAPPKNKP
jgi:hypothetical protein